MSQDPRSLQSKVEQESESAHVLPDWSNIRPLEESVVSQQERAMLSQMDPSTLRTRLLQLGLPELRLECCGLDPKRMLSVYDTFVACREGMKQDARERSFKQRERLHQEHAERVKREQVGKLMESEAELMRRREVNRVCTTSVGCYSWRNDG